MERIFHFSSARRLGTRSVGDAGVEKTRRERALPATGWSGGAIVRRRIGCRSRRGECDSKGRERGA